MVLIHMSWNCRVTLIISVMPTQEKQSMDQCVTKGKAGTGGGTHLCKIHEEGQVFPGSISVRQESQLVPADFLDPTFCPLSRRAWEEIKHKVKKN